MRTRSSMGSAGPSANLTTPRICHAHQAAAGARRKKASDSKPSKPAITRRSGRLQGKGPSFAGEVDENDKVVGAGGGRKRKADGEAGSSSDEGDESPGGWTDAVRTLRTGLQHGMWQWKRGKCALLEQAYIGIQSHTVLKDAVPGSAGAGIQCWARFTPSHGSVCRVARFVHRAFLLGWLVLHTEFSLAWPGPR